MVTRKDSNAQREKRHLRIRATISGTPACPRLCVYRSLKNIQAQIIDDTVGNTLCSASTLDKAAKDLEYTDNTEAAAFVGKTIAERALAKGISEVVFDRGGFIYHGKVQALAEAAREAGLKF